MSSHEQPRRNLLGLCLAWAHAAGGRERALRDTHTDAATSEPAQRPIIHVKLLCSNDLRALSG